MVSSNPLTFGFIIDRPEDLVPQMDTTLLLVSECNRRGHRALLTTPDRLYLHGSQLRAQWWECSYRHGHDFVASLTDAGDRDLDNCCDLMLMRKDPPVDTTYLALIQLLNRTSAKIINDPALLVIANEKMIPLNGPYAVKDTFVSKDPAFIQKIVTETARKWVIKPTNNKGGTDVSVIGRDHGNTQAIIQAVTMGGTAHAVIQPFLSAVRLGDKRIVMLQGKAIGWMNRVPKEDDFRANIHLGATPKACELNDRDKDICAWVASEIPPDKAPFVAIDIIDGCLTEVNITSPSGIPEINQVMGLTLEADIVDAMQDIAESVAACH
ncbi:MAG: ATP-grasp domain-containing protein [Acidiferrobacter sp.]